MPRSFELQVDEIANEFRKAIDVPVTIGWGPRYLHSTGQFHKGGVPTGSLLVEFSGSLQDNSRTYFGPVNIDRMSVKLLDDKGNVLNFFHKRKKIEI